MKLFSRAPDGGSKSGVTGYFLIEAKRLFSVVLLHFAPGSREAFHSHAFNAITLWLTGGVQEQHLDGTVTAWAPGQVKLTRRSTFHRVFATRGTWALSLRGPWANQWQESRHGELVTLTHGRREL